VSALFLFSLRFPEKAAAQAIAKKSGGRILSSSG
jgi:hypothetical protein